MNMLDEIRRERACELFGEGFRMDDLKRWGIAHINLTGRKLGRHVWGRHTKQRKPMMPLTSVNPVIIQKISFALWAL